MSAALDAFRRLTPAQVRYLRRHHRALAEHDEADIEGSCDGAEAEEYRAMAGAHRAMVAVLDALERQRLYV